MDGESNEPNYLTNELVSHAYFKKLPQNIPKREGSDSIGIVRGGSLEEEGFAGGRIRFYSGGDEIDSRD